MEHLQAMDDLRRIGPESGQRPHGVPEPEMPAMMGEMQEDVVRPFPG